MIEHRGFPKHWAEGLCNPIFTAGDQLNYANYKGIDKLESNWVFLMSRRLQRVKNNPRKRFSVQNE